MPVIIVPAAALSGGSSSAEGHSHSNFATLSKLSTDTSGNLCFNGKIIGENSRENAINITLTDIQAAQKFFTLPDDCDTTRAITLSLNGASFPQGDFWEVRENVNSTDTDLIAWNGLALENIAQAGDIVIITYYTKL